MKLEVTKRMADTTLTNKASVAGNYNSIPVALETDAVVTNLIDGLTVTKTADRQNWATGLLTYSITVTNNAVNALEAPVITDVLDTALVKFVENSVTVNGVSKTAAYDEATGTLTVDLETIAAGGKAEVTFQVQKAE